MSHSVCACVCLPTGALVTECDSEIDRRPLRARRTTVGTMTIAHIGVDQLQDLQAYTHTC